MNLQRLEEVRSNLDNLVSLASIIGPQDDMVAEVHDQLGKIGVMRLTVFEPESPALPAPPVAPAPVSRVIRPVCNLVAVAVIEVRRQLKRIADFRTTLFPPVQKKSPPPKAKPELKPAPKPEPRRNLHNHITRDIKPRGECPGCDSHHHSEDRRRQAQLRKPEKFEIPPAPPRSRKIAHSTTYNPERYVPYKVLWAKVIIRAAYDYALWKDSKDLRLKKFAQDAERWLFEPSDIELSFENICSSFDFPIERIRTRTRAMTKDDVKKLEFRERHGRFDPGALTSGDDE